MPGPNVRGGGVPALLCSRDQSELLYLRDKAAPKHPALFFFHLFFSLPIFFVLSAVSLMKMLQPTDGRVDGNADKETNLS